MTQPKKNIIIEVLKFIIKIFLIPGKQLKKKKNKKKLKGKNDINI